MNPLRQQSRSATRSMNRGDSFGINAAPSFSPGLKGKKEDEAYFGDDYDKKGMPIQGHPYHHKSDAELRYIIKDAHAAAEANHPKHGGDPKVHGKYLDQVNDAHTVLGYRKKHSIFGPKPKPKPMDAQDGGKFADKIPSDIHPEHHAVLTQFGFKRQGGLGNLGEAHVYKHPDGSVATHQGGRTHLKPAKESMKGGSPYHYSPETLAAHIQATIPQKYVPEKMPKKFSDSDWSEDVYEKKQKMPKYNVHVSPLAADYHTGGRMLRQRLPGHTKEQHIAAGDAHRDRGHKTKLEHSRAIADAHDALKKTGKDAGPLVSGVGSAHFPDHTKNKLRKLAHDGGKYHSAAMAHYAAAGLHHETALKRLHT